MRKIIYYIILLYSLQFTVTSCTFDHPLLDWPPDDPEPIEQDTPCAPIMYDQPAFVSGWWYIPFDIFGDVKVCAYPHCVTVPIGTDVTAILDSLLNEFNPAYDYTVYQSQDAVVFIAEGTNNRSLFLGKVWIRPESVNSGWGFDCNAQSFFFLDALTFDQYMTAIDSFPSFDRFMFQFTNWDSIEYIKAFDKILECRIGRIYADLRYLPFTFPDSVYDKFEAAGWDNVLH